MQRYVALLRGINVGGNNKINMLELRSLFKEIGFVEVITYINSGNVIFDSTDDIDKIKRDCEVAIKNKFKLDIPVFIIAINDLSNILERVPSWWDNDKESKHNAVFIIHPTTLKEVIEKIGDIREEYEKVYYDKNIIFWSAPIKTFSKTKWSKISSTPIYNDITIRNANTTKKIVQLFRL